MIYYNRCDACGFVFSCSFDDWNAEAFGDHIYNADYLKVDPDYAESRPAANARLIANLFAKTACGLPILDYGGGNGRMGEILATLGFSSITTFDPWTPRFAASPHGSFQIITCFETLEHVTDPITTVRDIEARLIDSAIVVFSTLLQPPDFDERGLFWWYVGPRNGHISIYSRKALVTLWQRAGFSVASVNANIHIAYKTIPDFARHLFRTEKSPLLS